MQEGKKSPKGRKCGYIRDRDTEVGRFLTEIRISRGISQEEVAQKLGMSRSCICRIETGERQHRAIHGALIRNLAEAYNVPMKDILEKWFFPQSVMPFDEDTE